MRARFVETHNVHPPFIAMTVIVKWTRCLLVATSRFDLNSSEAQIFRQYNPDIEQKEFLTLVSPCDRNGIVMPGREHLYAEETTTLEHAQKIHAEVVRKLADGQQLGDAA